VQAESAVSKALSAAVEVVVAGADGKLPNLYLVAIGISAYVAPLTLHHAAKDARVLGQTFRDKGYGVFGGVEVKLLTDGEATPRGLAATVAWLGPVMTPRDVGILSRCRLVAWPLLSGMQRTHDIRRTTSPATPRP